MHQPMPVFPEPIATFLQIALALNKAVAKRTGLEPLLSASIYDYGLEIPAWDWATLARKIEEVRAGLDELPKARRHFIQDLLDAFALMVREGEGEVIPYAERVATYLQVPGERVPEATLAQLEQELRGLLQEADYPDDLAVAIPQWRARQSIRGERLEQMGQELMAEAQRRTHANVVALPPQHRVVLTFPHHYPHRGYSDYARDFQGHVYLSGDIEWEIPGLRHMIAHESFPGHQAFSALREAGYRAGTLPVEGTLYFSNTPITPIVEGLCEIGQLVLGMVESIDDHIYEAYNNYCNAISTNLAFDCNAESMKAEEAAQRLVERTYVDRLFAERYAAFFTHPLWCTGFPHYWYGRQLMADLYRQMQHHLPEFFRMIYTEAHSVRTLRSAVQGYLDSRQGYI